MFTVMHMDRSADDDPPLESLSSLFDELVLSGIWDGNVSVVNEDSGWCISAHRDGRVVFEHLLDGQARHMIPVPKADVIKLWELLINGDMQGLLREPWKPGYV